MGVTMSNGILHFPFGKYEGLPATALPKSYLEWLLRSSGIKLGSGFQAELEAELARREGRSGELPQMRPDRPRPIPTSPEGTDPRPRATGKPPRWCVWSARLLGGKSALVLTGYGLSEVQVAAAVPASAGPVEYAQLLTVVEQADLFLVRTDLEGAR